MSEIAILMAAGLGTRMRPITDKIPKPLVKIHGRPMIETVIDGLKKRGVQKILVVVGHLGNQFNYLCQNYENIRIIENHDYQTINNISSIYSVADELIGIDSDVFICEADLYVKDNSIFNAALSHSCYFGKMVKGYSSDWVFDTDVEGRVIRVGKEGEDCFNMVGIAWFKRTDAQLLGRLVKDTYDTEGFQNKFWDDVVNDNLDKLDLIVHEISGNELVEIDTVEELAEIDNSYRRA